MPHPCLCLVTGRAVAGRRALLGQIDDAVAGGVDMVQLRDKELPASDLLDLAVAIQDAIKRRALFLVNDRVDVALAAGADGVQLGELALPPAAARRIVGPGRLIGRSVHSQEGAAAAQAEGADFVIVGAMFPTSTHPGVSPAGPGLLRDIRREMERSGREVPLIGIGGITEGNAGEVMRAGATGVAVITGILASADAGQAAARIKAAMLDSLDTAAAAPERGAQGGEVGA